MLSLVENNGVSRGSILPRASKPDEIKLRQFRSELSQRLEVAERELPSNRLAAAILSTLADAGQRSSKSLTRSADTTNAFNNKMFSHFMLLEVELPRRLSTLAVRAQLDVGLGKRVQKFPQLLTDEKTLNLIEEVAGDLMRRAVDGTSTPKRLERFDRGLRLCTTLLHARGGLASKAKFYETLWRAQSGNRPSQEILDRLAPHITRAKKEHIAYLGNLIKEHGTEYHRENPSSQVALYRVYFLETFGQGKGIYHDILKIAPGFGVALAGYGGGEIGKEYSRLLTEGVLRTANWLLANPPKAVATKAAFFALAESVIIQSGSGIRDGTAEQRGFYKSLKDLVSVCRGDRDITKGMLPLFEQRANKDQKKLVDTILLVS